MHEFLCKNVHNSEESNAHVLIGVSMVEETRLPGDSHCGQTP